MRFVHQTHHNVRLVCIFRCQLAPQTGELVVGWAALADNCTVPAGVIVNVDHTVGASGQARLHQVVVLGHVPVVEVAAQLALDQVLPPDVQSEHVELVLLDEMVHLIGGTRRRIDPGERAVALHRFVSLSSTP